MSHKAMLLRPLPTPPSACYIGAQPREHTIETCNAGSGGSCPEGCESVYIAGKVAA
jgi:hypothetical protein